jgi:hypothetical protein
MIQEHYRDLCNRRTFRLLTNHTKQPMYNIGRYQLVPTPKYSNVMNQNLFKIYTVDELPSFKR